MGRGGVVERKVCVALAAPSGSQSIYICLSFVSSFNFFICFFIPFFHRPLLCMSEACVLGAADGGWGATLSYTHGSLSSGAMEEVK